MSQSPAARARRLVGRPVGRRRPSCTSSRVSGPAAAARRRATSASALLLLFVVMLLVAGAAGLWLSRQLNPPGTRRRPVNFTVNAGDTIDSVSKRLKAQGIITNDAVFRWYADHKADVDLQPGYYTLKPRDTMGNILAVLRTPPAQTFDNVVFPEGFTVTQIGQRLQETIPRLQQAAVLQAATDGSIRSKYEPRRHQQPRGPDVPGQVPDRRQRHRGQDRAAAGDADGAGRRRRRPRQDPARPGLQRPDHRLHGRARGEDGRGPAQDRPGHPQPHRARHAAAGRRHALLRPGSRRRPSTS